MNTIINIISGKGPIRYLLAAVFAFGALQTVQAVTKQSFLFYGQNGTSDWSDKNSWKYNNGGNTANWTTPSGAPDGGNFSYDVYFRSGMAAPNNNKTQSYNPNWDHVVTFSGAQQVGVTHQPLHLDAGSSAENPIVFTATDSSYGLTSSSTLNIAETTNGYLRIDSGTYSFGYVILANGSGNTGVLTIEGGTLKTTGNYSRLGAGGGNGILTVKTGAVFDNSEAGNKNFTLGQDANSSATLNVEGGEVTVKGFIALNYNAGAVTSVVNVTDGGVLAFNKMYLNNPGQGGTINIDGGTLKACGSNASYFSSFLPAHNSLNVYIGANGVTIDTDAHDNITIGEDFQEASSSPGGGLTVKGGRTVTFSNMGDISGAFVVGDGTALHWFDQDATVSNTCAIASLALGAGSTIFIDGNATAVDALPSTVTTTATAENKATVEIVFSAIPAAGTSFTLFPAESADVFDVKPRLGGLELSHKTTIDNGNLVVTINAEDYTWNGTQTNWGDVDAWTKDGADATWANGNNAIFATANAAVTLAANVAVAEARFTANAEISGSNTLTVPSVSVGSGVSVAISAPTAGSLEKTGAGTLTLSQSRTEQTDIAEGTLVMSGEGTTIPWGSVLLGTEAGKTAVLKFENGATLTGSIWNMSLGHDSNGSVGGGVTVELHKEDGELNVGNRLTIGWNDGDVGKFYHNDGTMTVGEQFRVSSQAGSSGEFTMNGGTMTVANNLYIGCNFNVVKGVFNMNGGTFTCNGTNYVAFSKNDYPAELHINGGTFKAVGTFIAGNGAGSEAVIELSSTGGTPGVLETKGLTLGIGSATLTFNGGELKAVGDLESTGLIKNGITVRVGANGGIINANGKAVTIPAAIGAAGDTGGMTYKGGGAVTLSVAPAYSGTTTVEVGTTLVVPAAIAGANLKVTIPDGLASGLYKVVAVSGDGAFASDVLSSATLPSDANMRFYLDNGNKEIWCIYSSNASDHIWIGGSTGSLNEGSNWFSGNVPESGIAIIGSASAATLTNPEGSGFAATTIVVPKDSAAVTISGAKLSNMVKITNNSSNTIEFESAVEFADNVDVVQNTGAVKFTGGATGTWLARATDIHGTYNFTGSGERTEHGGTTVKSDGVYNLPNATFYKHNGDFHMEAGGRAEVKAAKINAKDSDKKLLGTFNGEFKVNGEFLVSAPGGDNPTHYTCNSGNGTFIVDKIRVNQNACIVPCNKTIMGSGGIIRGAGYVRVVNSGSHEFGSYADWTMYYDHLGDTTTAYFVLYKRSSSGSWSTVTFDTTDYYDNTIGRTITSEAQIGAENAASAAKFGVTVKGIGKFVFANTHDDAADDKKIFSGGLTVNDSATVEVMPNSWPGKGAVTLNDEATLKVAESGTVALGGNLTLNGNAKLAFNFTRKDMDPVLAIPEGNTVTAGGTVKVVLSMTGGSRPAYGEDGKHVLTLSKKDTSSTGAFYGKAVEFVDSPTWVDRVAVEDGEIVLYVKRMGTTVFLK